MNSMQSLRSLPPKQALVLALAERARRTKSKKAQLLAQEQAQANDAPLTFRDVPSLVLNKDHVFSDLFYKKAPYKVYWGGRGSAKSWAFAEALIRKAAALPIRVLCAREYQNTIKDSSHKLLHDTIKRLGLEEWFTVTADTIRSKVGAEFIFKGLHHNEEGIKSTEGIDFCWVEEAQTVTFLSWNTLLPTIRKDGAEIWISFNLISEDDATYQKFVANRRTGSIVHKVNYDSNPYFGGKLRQDMEDDRAADYHMYEHVWLGMPRKISAALILSGKYRVEEFDDNLWKEADRLLFGNDFGFAQDPLALIRMFILGKTLYITHELYRVGLEINEMDEAYGSIPNSREWPIKADGARPELISHLRTLGYNVSAAKKWDGSVKDGIAYLRGFTAIIIHPRCVKTAEEARRYSYKVDRNVVDEHGQPQVLPIIVDKYNHAMDGIRYGLDGYIQQSGAMALWARQGELINNLNKQQ